MIEIPSNKILFVIKHIVLFLFLIVNLKPSFSQNSHFYIGTNIPLFYSAGYTQDLFKVLSLDFQAGVLTDPYDRMVLSILEAFDTDELLVNTIGEAFTLGYNLQSSLRFNFGSFYTGAYYSFVALHANESPAQAIENYYGFTIPDRQAYNLFLNSELHNAGFLIGRKFKFPNPSFGLNIELSTGKTLTSNSFLKNKDGNTLPFLSGLISNELNYYYSRYAYLPSVNVFFVYTLGKKSDR